MVLGDGLAVVVIVVIVVWRTVLVVVVYRRVGGRPHHKLVGRYRLVARGTRSRAE